MGGGPCHLQSDCALYRGRKTGGYRHGAASTAVKDVKTNRQRGESEGNPELERG